MRLLIIDPFGEGLDFALRSQRDGHQVKLNVRQKKGLEDIGRGLVDVVEDFRPWLRWADLVFNTDNTTYLRELDVAREQGIPVLGATQETALWELDRQAGTDIFRQHDIRVPDSKEFHDYDSAIRYVKREGRRFVSKPSGVQEDKSLSYVSQTPADMVYMLERWKQLGKNQPQFVLQEFIDGIEMAVGGWFGPGGFSQGWCENFEHKKFMDGDLGCATGEQGTVLRFVRSSKLARQVLMPLSDTLSSLNYTGYIDVNTIIDDRGEVWPLEFTCRPGWPTLDIQLALNLGDTVQWLLDLYRGEDARNWWMDRVAIGVVLSIPDYPYSHKPHQECVGIPIYGIKPTMWKHLHPKQMMLAHAPADVGGQIITMPMPATAGDYVLVMTAHGRDVQTCRERVYSRLSRLTVPNSPMWRTDIGLRLSEQLPKLAKHGFATGMAYNLLPTSSKSSAGSALSEPPRSSANPGERMLAATN